jgi:hypothetical protein
LRRRAPDCGVLPPSIKGVHQQKSDALAQLAYGCLRVNLFSLQLAVILALCFGPWLRQSLRCAGERR